jgi:two-component system phosphate regulon response regulator OmpR
MHNILIVDDDAKINNLLAKFLTQNQIHTFQANNTYHATEILQQKPINLIILDIMMPQENGIQFLEKLRHNLNLQIPVILLTAMDETADKINGLSIGADDYITKPFEPQELLARIHSILRRMKNNFSENNLVPLGEFQFNSKRGILLHNQIEIILTSTEMLLLQELVQKPRQPLSRKYLAQKTGLIINERTIDVQITRLRKKIHDDPPKYIQSIRHVGYAIFPDH